MSLDIWLVGTPKEVECECDHCGNKHTRMDRETFFDFNITHNLTRMADEAGIYDCLWRPDESGITHARQLIEPLRAGIAAMERDPARFKKFDASNGWGTYEHFLPWLVRLLAACMENPGAEIGVSR